MINYHWQKRCSGTTSSRPKRRKGGEIPIENSKLFNWKPVKSKLVWIIKGPRRVCVYEWFERLEWLSRGKSNPNVAQKWLNLITGNAYSTPPILLSRESKSSKIRFNLIQQRRTQDTRRPSKLNKTWDIRRWAEDQSKISNQRLTFLLDVEIEC